jgi:hypothetical protein
VVVDVFSHGTLVGRLDLEGRRIVTNNPRLKKLIERYFAEGIPELVPADAECEGLLGDGLVMHAMTPENLPAIRFQLRIDGFELREEA